MAVEGSLEGRLGTLQLQDDDWPSTSGAAPAPFPLELAVSPARPREYALAKLVRENPPLYQYKGEHLTPAEKASKERALEIKYPVGHARETPAAREKGKKNCKAFVWERALDLPGTEWIPLEFRDTFRADASNQVISCKAKAFAWCAYDAEHMFPWVRGGLSVEDNLTPLAFGFNRYKKNHKICIGYTEPGTELQTGLPISLILHLMAPEDDQGHPLPHLPSERDFLEDMLLRQPCTKMNGLQWNMGKFVDEALSESQQDIHLAIAWMQARMEDARNS